MNEEKVNEICLKHGFTKLKISKIPSWIDKLGLEGIEYNGFEVTPFWSVDGERVYEQATGEKIDRVLEELDNKKHIEKNDIKETEIKPEIKPDIKPNIDELALYDAMIPPEPSVENLEKTLFQKLLVIQEQIGVVVKNSTNPFYKSKYADINKYLELVKPILNKNGIVLLQPFEYKNCKNILSTILLNAEDGDMIRSEIELPVIADPQKLGAAITYFRRFSIQSLLAMQAEDDDGNSNIQKGI